jgi:hypothetical protein
MVGPVSLAQINLSKQDECCQKDTRSGFVKGRITEIPDSFAVCSPRRYALRIVGVLACVASFTGERGVRHSVEVTAETLYESRRAKALASI